MEAWTPGASNINWLVTDHLGTPRMILDQTGSLANVKRHDYLPFGEEIFAPTAGRTSAQGYSGDAIRQQFTSYERDIETGLDYAQARYFSNVQGRFTGIDPSMSSAKPAMPQSWNRYAYCLNNPLLFIDPTGLTWYEKKGSNQPEWFDKNPGDDYKEITKFIYQAVDGTWISLDSSSNKWWGGYASLEEAVSGGSVFRDPIRSLDNLFKDIKADFDRFVDDPLGRGGLGDPAFMMLGAPGPFSEFGSISNAAKEGTTTLYRTVLQNELDDIAVTGAYRLPQGHAEVKGFFSTAEEAAGFARKMFQRAPGEGPYTITSITVPNSFLRGSQWQSIAGEGNAMFLRTMPSGPVKVFTFSPNPNFKFWEMCK